MMRSVWVLVRVCRRHKILWMIWEMYKSRDSMWKPQWVAVSLHSILFHRECLVLYRCMLWPFVPRMRLQHTFCGYWCKERCYKARYSNNLFSKTLFTIFCMNGVCTRYHRHCHFVLLMTTKFHNWMSHTWNGSMIVTNARSFYSDNMHKCICVPAFARFKTMFQAQGVSCY